MTYVWPNKGRLGAAIGYQNDLLWKWSSLHPAFETLSSGRDRCGAWQKPFHMRAELKTRNICPFCNLNYWVTINSYLKCAVSRIERSFAIRAFTSLTLILYLVTNAWFHSHSRRTGAYFSSLKVAWVSTCWASNRSWSSESAEGLDFGTANKKHFTRRKSFSCTKIILFVTMS